MIERPNSASALDIASHLHPYTKCTDRLQGGRVRRPRIGARAGETPRPCRQSTSATWSLGDRRAYRSGENEYLLNGQKVRLRDVTELLSDSGLAERTYTIIGQGLIDQALSIRAEERRLLFEEADQRLGGSADQGQRGRSV